MGRLRDEIEEILRNEMEKVTPTHLPQLAQVIADYVKSKVPKKEIENIIHTACMEYHTNYDEYSQVPTQLWKFLDRCFQALADFYKEG